MAQGLRSVLGPAVWGRGGAPRGNTLISGSGAAVSAPHSLLSEPHRVASWPLCLLLRGLACLPDDGQPALWAGVTLSTGPKCLGSSPFPRPCLCPSSCLMVPGQGLVSCGSAGFCLPPPPTPPPQSQCGLALSPRHWSLCSHRYDMPGGYQDRPLDN